MWCTKFRVMSFVVVTKSMGPLKLESPCSAGDFAQNSTLLLHFCDVTNYRRPWPGNPSNGAINTCSSYVPWSSIHHGRFPTLIDRHHRNVHVARSPFPRDDREFGTVLRRGVNNGPSGLGLGYDRYHHLRTVYSHRRL